MTNMALEPFDLTKNPFLAWARNAGACNVKLMEFAAINASAVFDYAQKLSRAHSPQEFADVVTSHVRDQFESLTEQIEELSALTQKTTSKNACLSGCYPHPLNVGCAHPPE
jgi:phage-related tail protein